MNDDHGHDNGLIVMMQQKTQRTVQFSVQPCHHSPDPLAGYEHGIYTSMSTTTTPLRQHNAALCTFSPPVQGDNCARRVER
ncbi:hypothetical protein KV580_23540 [Pseudomonas chlororaphis]|nr:hypothetical protein [Pseudomonas chlororaphis]